MLGNAVTRRYGGAGLPDGTIDIHLRGSAGQSFGAFVPQGHHAAPRRRRQRLRRQGPVAAGGSSCVPTATRPFVAEENIIAGNVIGYGATGGEIFLRGVVGERFCVRNSGATAVVEGVGDHGCEYMTGGRVVVLGPTGRNFGAGMSGGIAYVYDPHDVFAAWLNGEMVELQAARRRRSAVRCATIVQRHAELTGSPVAAGAPRRLGRRGRPRSSKVMPHRLPAGADGDAAGRGRRPRRGSRRWIEVMEASSWVRSQGS